LGSDAKELEARAAVEGVSLTVVAVPRDSSSRPWIEARNRALELEGPVFSAVVAGEVSARRVLDTIHTTQGNRRRVTPLPSPGHLGWNLASMLNLLGNAGVLSADEFLQAQPQSETATPPPPKFEEVEIYLAKTGSARDFDVLVETGRRCPHKAWVRMHSRKAPKKYNGVLRYLDKLDPPGHLVRTELCTYSGCGLVRVSYEVASPVEINESSSPENGAPGSSLGMGRGPP
jgi:hypothetical protein